MCPHRGVEGIGGVFSMVWWQDLAAALDFVASRPPFEWYRRPVMLHLRENFYGKDLRADVSSHVEPRWTQSPEEKGKYASYLRKKKESTIITEPRELLGEVR
jgi:hypothetical protein